MVNDLFAPAPDPDRPQPYDTVYLHADNLLGVDPQTPLVVADDHPDQDLYELTHQDHHPAYWDWAAIVEAADIATVVRITDGAARRWSPAP
ncbi:DUF6211 family protein [Streptomyces albidoflavus]